MSLSGLLVYNDHMQDVIKPDIEVIATPCLCKGRHIFKRWLVEFMVLFPGDNIPYHFDAFDTFKLTLASAVSYTITVADDLANFFYWYHKNNPGKTYQELAGMDITPAIIEDYFNNLHPTDFTEMEKT